MDLKELRIIDFKKKGNVVRFYLGDKNLQEYYGDDWEDVPYDCNAETVYREYITGSIDIAFPFDSYVLEPCNEYHGCVYCKDDMSNRNVPCIVYVPHNLNEGCFDDCFSYWVGNDNAFRIYFWDIIDTNEKGQVFCNGNRIPGTTMMLITDYPKEKNNE